MSDSPANFDPAEAVRYGLLVGMAYEMYESDRSNPTPPVPSAFPSAYNLTHWVQMKDFVIEDGSWTFYGFIAQTAADESKWVLAIRGTDNNTELWDDLVSGISESWDGAGKIGAGFKRIYESLRVVPPPPELVSAAKPALAMAEAKSTESFADQVANAVLPVAARSEHLGAPLSEQKTKAVEVVGHSLGAALATLYVMQNAAKQRVQTPRLLTFASPFVGDRTFKKAFDDLDLVSWRVVNKPDLVPKLPPFIFEHVNTLLTYDSGAGVRETIECRHSLATYLHLLDHAQPISSDCEVSQPARLSATFKRRTVSDDAAAGREIEVPVSRSSGTTINITIKID